MSGGRSADRPPRDHVRTRSHRDRTWKKGKPSRYGRAVQHRAGRT
jgi:hypothetical protein